MYIGTLAAWDEERRYLPEVLDRAVAFLKTLDPEGTKPGRYAIQGDDIFASVECGAGRSEAERRFELHRRYLDVQMLLAGHERQDIAPFTPSTPPVEDRLRDGDIAFYDAPGPVLSVSMHPGMFIVYFPGELHAPGLLDGDGRYRKVVVKVAARLVS